MAAPVWRYWQRRGYLREGRAALAAIRDRLPAAEGRCCYAVLTALGGIAYWQRDLPAGEEAYARAVALAEQTAMPPDWPRPTPAPVRLRRAPAILDDDVAREVRLVGALRRLRELTGTELVDHP